MTEAGLKRLKVILGAVKGLAVQAVDLAFAEGDQEMLSDMTLMSEAVDEAIDSVRLERELSGQEC